MTIVPPSKFSVGSVISGAFGSYRRNFWTFSFLMLLGFMVLFAVIFVGVFVIAGTVAGSSLDERTASMFAGEMTPGQILLVVVGGFVALVLGITPIQLATAGICFGTVQHLRNQRSSFGACLSRAVASLLPIVGVTLLVILIFGAAALPFMLLAAATSPWLFAIFVIPLVYLYIRLLVVIPVTIAERPGIVGSLSRSFALTRGQGWRIFSLLLILFVMSLPVSYIGETASESLPEVGWILDLALNVVLTTLSAVLTAVSYVELRRAKEGFGVEDIAAVFD
jgi:hypothetical protein